MRIWINYVNGEIFQADWILTKRFFNTRFVKSYLLRFKNNLKASLKENKKWIWNVISQ